MRVEHRRLVQGVVLGIALIGLPRPARAQATKTYDEAYEKYLAAARRADGASGELWMSDLTSDRIARHVDDLVTISVVESLSASGAADSNVAKSGAASAALPGRLGSNLSRLLPATSDTKFQGAGATTRTTQLSTTLTARITEVLPSGDFVVEGVREVDINGDRTLVVLSGVVRPADIQPGNVILSSQVGQLRISSVSEGLVHDSLTPGWLIRVLNKIF